MRMERQHSKTYWRQIQWGYKFSGEKDNPFHKQCRTIIQPHARNWSLTLTLQQKQILLNLSKNLNVRAYTVELLKDPIGDGLTDVSLGKDFSNSAPKTQPIRER